MLESLATVVLEVALTVYRVGEGTECRGVIQDMQRDEHWQYVGIRTPGLKDENHSGIADIPA